MKKLILAASALIAVNLISCQPQKTESVEETVESPSTETSEKDQRPSPTEVKEGMIGGKSVQVHYGSPSVKGRTIWGDLVPYNVVWRTGANEATYLDFAEPMTVEGKPVPAGKYSLFTIPKESGKWTVILNSEWDLEHGHFQYDEKKDFLRVEVSPVWEESSTERLSIEIESPGLVIRWEKLKLPISVQ